MGKGRGVDEDPLHAAVSAAVDAVFAGVLDEVETGMNLDDTDSPRSPRDYADKWVEGGG